MADTLTLKAGSNVSIVSDGTYVTVSATDTKVSVDSTLSATSTNPVHNKVIYTALAGKQATLTAGTGISISGSTISCTVSGGSGSNVTVDSSMSSTSTNPVQNKVIYTALAAKQDKLTAGTGISISGNTISCTVSGGSGGTSVTVDTSLSSTSTNPVQNKVIYAALAAKQDKMTIDSALNSASTNPIQNAVVSKALDTKQDELKYETWTFTLSDGTTVTKTVYTDLA